MDNASNLGLLSGLKCLALVARFYQLPTDIKQLLKEFSAPEIRLTEVNLLRAANHIGLKATSAKLDCSQLSQAALPAIGMSFSGEYFLIANYNPADKSFLIQQSNNGQTQLFNFVQLKELWTGKIILVTRRYTLMEAKAILVLACNFEVQTLFNRCSCSIIVYSNIRDCLTNFFSGSNR